MAVSTRQALLQALSAAGGSYVSGQQLAETLGVSRAAVHKAAAALTAQGYALEAAPRRGYRLAGGDPFCAEAIGDYPAPIYLYDTLEPGMKDYKKFAKFAFTAKLRNGLFRNMGACMAPQTAYYNLLGMETLGLRMERACDNAMQLAAYLETIPGISVNYPGLASSPWNGVAKQLLDGRFGAILTIRVGSKERAFAIMNALTIPQIVSNIGDTKTLIVHPESTLAAHSTEQEKIDAAVFDDMIRISVGIEDIEDLKQDFTAAIQNTAG